MLRNDCYCDFKLYIVRLITKKNDSKKNGSIHLKGYIYTVTYPVLTLICIRFHQKTADNFNYSIILFIKLNISLSIGIDTIIEMIMRGEIKSSNNSQKLEERQYINSQSISIRNFRLVNIFS